MNRGGCRTSRATAARNAARRLRRTHEGGGCGFAADVVKSGRSERGRARRRRQRRGAVNGGGLNRSWGKMRRRCRQTRTRDKSRVAPQRASGARRRSGRLTDSHAGGAGSANYICLISNQYWSASNTTARRRSGCGAMYFFGGGGRLQQGGGGSQKNTFRRSEKIVADENTRFSAGSGSPYLRGFFPHRLSVLKPAFCRRRKPAFSASAD